MTRLILSFAERMFPRAASALIMILLAALVSPGVVGVYALGILALTFFQSVTDASIRQIAVRAAGSAAGEEFIRRYRVVAAVVGTLFMLFALLAMAVSLSPQLRVQVLALSPLLAIPLICVFRVRAVAHLQTTNNWASLARSQLVAAAISLAASIPILFLTKSLWASSIQFVLTEAVFTALVIRSSRRRAPEVIHVSDGPPITREYWHISSYSALGWAQTQADRVLLTFFAGPAVLGLYTFAQSLARSVGDSLSTSTANVLRPTILKESISIAEIRRKTEPVLSRACHLSGLSTLLVLLAAEFAFPLFLDEVWYPALAATSIMSLAVGPTLLAWSITVILIAVGRIKWAAPIKALGVAMALPIALLAVIDIRYAAALVVFRDIVIAILMLCVSRGAIGWRTIRLFLVWFLGLGLMIAFSL